MATLTGPAAIASRSVRTRLIPFLFLLYVVAYLDRVNVSFAAASMSVDLGMDTAAYGLGAGIFFIGYFLFEVPSNLVLRRVGARLWIARIMITWGVVAGMQAFVRNETQFYVVRFLLGAAEAGFFPGIVLYLTYWVPRRERARTYATFLTATAVAGTVGAPLSGAILLAHGWFGLAGWQWLFLLEALPAIVLGIVVLRVLPDGPADARWLSGTQRRALQDVIAADGHEADAHRTRLRSLTSAFRSGRVWVLALLYFSVLLGFYAISLFLPLLVDAELPGTGPVATGFITAVPYAAAVVAMVLIGRSSDRRGDRIWHIVVPLVVAAAGLVAASQAGGIAALAWITVSTAAVYSAVGPFWALPPSFLAGPAAAAGIAWVNSVGNLGGFVGPYSVGRLAQSVGVDTALLPVAAGLAVGAVLALLVGRRISAAHLT